MATLRQRLHRKNSSGIYDIIHLETSSDVVLRSDGTTAEDFFTAPKIPVLTADPASPADGEIWIITDQGS